MILKGYIFSILYVLLCVCVALILYKLGAPKRVTRKVVHILVGFEWVILYSFMGAGSIHFFVVCLIFLVLLSIEYKIKLMPMLSSDGDNAPGTVYYALAMSVLGFITIFVPDMIHPFGIAVFCTSFGDGFAGLLGQSIKQHNPKIWNSKTLIGTVSNFVISFVVTFAFSEIFGLWLAAWECLVVALFVAELELFCTKGLDNLAITLGAAILVYSFLNFSNVVDYLAPIILTPPLIAITYKKKALTVSGIFSALLLDLSVSVAFGNFGFITLFSFFVFSLIADKIKKSSKKQKQNVERGSAGECRTAFQVFANGFAAMLCALLYVAFDERVFLLAFVASLAEALSDTAASGIGAASSRTYDVFRFERCESGISGGMSVPGTIASFLGAFIISYIPWAFGKISLLEALLVALCAFLGAVFDSFLGSLVQAKYVCTECSKIVERSSHCGKPAKKYRGVACINNSAVNFISTVFSSVLVIVLACFFEFV